MTAPADYLRDIHGLDPIGWWPPAPGWIAVGIVALLVLVGLYWLLRSGYEFLGWRYDARRRLRGLRRRLGEQGAKRSAAELSELLRRIAIARCGRAACAGLSGEDWLAWLERNDPQGFDWRNEGQILLSLPYAPETRVDSVQVAQLERLIDAALKWVAAAVEKGEPACQGPERAYPARQRGYESGG